jgi:hypothetical protein
VLILPTTGRYFQVPYRSLVPKGIGNLIVAGRSIGGDKISHASVRNMMCCTVSGQGAGVAGGRIRQGRHTVRRSRRQEDPDRAEAAGRPARLDRRRALSVSR